MTIDQVLARGREIAASAAALLERRREVQARQREVEAKARAQERALEDLRTRFALGGADAPSEDELAEAADRLRDTEALLGGFERAVAKIRGEIDAMRPQVEAFEVALIEAATEAIEARVAARNAEDREWLREALLAPIAELGAPASNGRPLEEFVGLYLPRLGDAQLAPASGSLYVTLAGGARAPHDTPQAREAVRERLGLMNGEERA